MIFALNLPESVFLVNNRKSEHHLWILHIWISLGTKFKLKIKFLIFWTKFVHKEFFRWKWTEVNITIKFYILKLVKVPNLSLICQFWFLKLNLNKKVFLVKKRKRKHTIAFYIFQLPWAPNLTPHKKFWSLEKNLSNTSILNRRWKMWTLLLNSVYSS